MSGTSAIEWTDATWNPVTGCSKVSPGCAHCYAETLALTRLAGRNGYPGLPWTPENAAANVALRPDRLEDPLRWRKPRRVFVNSMSDLFHELVPDAFLWRVFDVMGLAHRHTFQVLTKRPARMRDFCQNMDINVTWRLTPPPFGQAWVLRNVWLGTSVENQRWANERIPLLLDTPAAVRFLSCEPLLGPLDLTPWLSSLGWVIVGGESGPERRPVDPAWVRDIRDQCVEAGVPFLFKQWGGRTPKAGGRLLDGRTWDEYPEVAA